MRNEEWGHYQIAVPYSELPDNNKPHRIAGTILLEQQSVWVKKKPLLPR